MPQIVVAGRPVFVTGASGGIGSELSRGLARRGARLALCARRPAPLEALASELRAAGAAVTVHPCDVGEPELLARAMDDAARLHGGLTGVVAAAGIGRHTDFRAQPLAEMERLVRTNLMGVLHSLHLALPHLERAGGGFAVTLSSVAGRLGQPGEAVYSASKFGVTGISEALSVELASLGVHVLTVYPGLVRTNLLSPEELARLPDRVRRTAIDPGPLAEAVLRALAQGRHELTMPGYAAAGYLVRTVAPRMFRRVLARMRSVDG